MISTLNYIISKRLMLIYIIFLFYFIFFDYKYFNLFSLCILGTTYFLKKDINISKTEKKILVLTPYIFYSKKLIIGSLENIALWNKTYLADTPFSFADLKLTIQQLACQSELNYLFRDKFNEMSERCFFGSYRYGPLFHLLNWDIDYKIVQSLLPFILYFLFFIFLHTLRSKSNLNEFEFNLLSISATANLLLTQLNIDLIIFLCIFFISKVFKQYRLFSISIILILALLKQHPLGILFGLLFIEKSWKKATSILLAIISFFTINIYFYNLDVNFLNGQPRPSVAQSSSGLLAFSQYFWVNLLNRAIGFRIAIIIFIALISLVLYLIVSKNFTTTISLNKNTENSEGFEAGILSWFLFISIYSNWDYRNIILLLLFLYFDFDKNTKLAILIIFLTSPMLNELNIYLLPTLIFFKFSSYIYVMCTCAQLLLKYETKYLKLISILFKKVASKNEQ
jgi:hypothetical protein